MAEWSGLDSELPAPSAAQEGDTFSAVDSGKIYFLSGGAWVLIGSNVGMVPLTFAAHPRLLTALPLADTEIIAGMKADLVGVKSGRLIVRVGVLGVAGSSLRVQYSADESAWSNLDGSNGPELSIDVLGTRDSGWFTIASGARAVNRYLRIVGKGGNGIASPEISLATLFFKP